MFIKPLKFKRISLSSPVLMMRRLAVFLNFKVFPFRWRRRAAPAGPSGALSLNCKKTGFPQGSAKRTKTGGSSFFPVGKFLKPSVLILIFSLPFCVPQNPTVAPRPERDPYVEQDPDDPDPTRRRRRRRSGGGGDGGGDPPQPPSSSACPASNGGALSSGNKISTVTFHHQRDRNWFRYEADDGFAGVGRSNPPLDAVQNITVRTGSEERSSVYLRKNNLRAFGITGEDTDENYFYIYIGGVRYLINTMRPNRAEEDGYNYIYGYGIGKASDEDHAVTASSLTHDVHLAYEKNNRCYFVGHTCPQSAEGFFERGRTAGITFERDGSAVSYIKDGLRDGAANGPLIPAKGSADPEEQYNFAGIKFDGNTKTVWFQSYTIDWDDLADYEEIVLYIGEERYEIPNRRSAWTGYRQAAPLRLITKVNFSGTGSPPPVGRETPVWYAYRYRSLPCYFVKTSFYVDDD